MQLGRRGRAVWQELQAGATFVGAWRDYVHSPVLRCLLLLVLACGAAGCLSPQRAVRDADAAAYEIIEEKQRAALGRTEPFDLARPAELLRERLLLSQNLPVAGRAGFGVPYLTPVPKQPGGISKITDLPADAIVVSHLPTLVGDTDGLVLAGDAFLVDFFDNADDAPRLSVAAFQPAPLRPPVEPIVLTLADALRVGAANSRSYQSAKESVYLAALSLDLRRDQFEFQFLSGLDADFVTNVDPDQSDVSSVTLSPSFSASKLFKSGASITTRLGLDLAKLLTGERQESLGLLADASIEIPLLAGAGAEVVAEPLHLAERRAVYAVWGFERFRREFIVSLITRYYDVLAARENAENAALAFRRLSFNVARTRSLAREGRLPEIRVDQIRSTQLRAEARLISARQSYEGRLDSFKVFLGLPPDAEVLLDADELARIEDLSDEVLPATLPAGGDALDPSEANPIDLTPTSLPDVPGPTTREQPQVVDVDPAGDRYSGLAGGREAAETLIRLALSRRLDLAEAYANVADAQRATVVAADGLESIFDLTGGASFGGGRSGSGAALDDATIRFDDGTYRAGLRLRLPVERTAERNSYRQSLITLDRAVRAAQETEDRVKIDVLAALRRLSSSARVQIQAEAVETARRRVRAETLLLEIGRGEVRDLTDANDDQTDAEQNFTEAVIDYRLSGLELQRDLGVLQVGPNGTYEPVPLPVSLQP